MAIAEVIFLCYVLELFAAIVVEDTSKLFSPLRISISVILHTETNPKTREYIKLLPNFMAILGNGISSDIPT